jgi:hypothetical protein
VVKRFDRIDHRGGGTGVDANQFDALSRVLASSSGRRTLLQGMAGSVAGVVLGSLLPGRASARPDRKRSDRSRHARKQHLRRREATVAVCHNGRTLTVPRSAMQGLLLNGDTLGSCPPASVPRGADPGCDVCPTCQFTTIQAAVDAARSGDVIGLCAITYRETVVIPVRANLRGLAIVGASSAPGGTVIDGDGNGPVIVLPAAGPALLLQRLTITGGDAEQGGGIFSTGQSLVLSSVRVTGNHATLAGGGIFSAGSREDDGATLQINASDITNNSARTGGGLFNGGAAFAVFSNDSTVTGNRASTSGGGIQNAGRVELQDTVVSGNTPTNCVGVSGC